MRLHRSMPRACMLPVVCIMGLAAAQMPAVSATFETLDVYGSGYSSTAVALSADGNSVVVNNGYSGTGQAYWWTAADGLAELGDLPGTAYSSTGTAISADGTVIVGDSSSLHPREAFRWTVSTGMSGLGVLPGDTVSYATDVSADGRVVVGMSSPDMGPSRAFRWTAETGMVPLMPQPGDYPDSAASAVSADGQHIVGAHYMGGAFRWTAQSGMVSLDTGPLDNANAMAVNNGGNVIAGYGNLSLDVIRPFKWTSETGTVMLDLPAGYTEGNVVRMSPDGSVMLGQAWVDYVRVAVLWDDAHGPRLLQDVLEQDYGLNLDGWSLSYANMSADGNVFAGGGINPQGYYQAWRAVVPEPSTVLLLLGAMGTFVLKHKR